MSVALVDAYGPGNSRASSGGETRIIRMGYGADELYTRWACDRSRSGRRSPARTGAPLFHETGVLWMARDGGPRCRRATLETLARAGVPHEASTRAELEGAGRRSTLGAIDVGNPRAGQRGVDGAPGRAGVAGEAARAGATSGSTPPFGRPRAADGSTTVSSPTGETTRAPVVRLRVRALAGQAVPGAPRRAHLPHAPGGLLLRRRPRATRGFAPPAMPAWLDLDGGDLRHPRSRGARLQGRRRTRTARASIRTPASAGRRPRGSPRARAFLGPAFPGARERAACSAPRSASTRTRRTATS